MASPSVSLTRALDRFCDSFSGCFPFFSLYYNNNNNKYLFIYLFIYLFLFKEKKNQYIMGAFFFGIFKTGGPFLT